ncbi:hypothetical protein TNCV_4259951 [Trichonephila clavipes]|nr:hypothetical protein TNCV_4259951 [Trichonephila clavipes]
MSCGRGSLVVKVTGSWLERHEFEPSIEEDPPCRGIRGSKVLLMVGCRRTKQLNRQERNNSTRQCERNNFNLPVGRNETNFNPSVNETPTSPVGTKQLTSASCCRLLLATASVTPAKLPAVRARGSVTACRTATTRP